MAKRIFLIVPLIIFHQACSFKYAPPELVLRLYQMMKDTHEILVNNHLTYWIHAGTLLGAVRHGGLIPWDDDLDIIIEKKNAKNFERLAQQFDQCGYAIKPWSFGYKICCKDGVMVSGCLYPWIDVMVGWQKISKKDLLPLKHYRFGAFYVMGPHNPIPYLNRVYRSWQTHAVIGNHTFNGVGEKFQLKESDKVPAQPLGPLQDRVPPKNKAGRSQALDDENFYVHISHEPIMRDKDTGVVVAYASVADLEKLVELINQLGFKTSADIVRSKIEQLSQFPLDRVFVAKLRETVVGLLALNVISPFYNPSIFTRIDTIVVDKAYRKKGVGKMLMCCAEDYAKSIAASRIFLTSGNHRQEAHEFFKSQGYISNATYFVKNFIDESSMHIPCQ